MVKPKKHLGQHFLVDERIAQKITDLLQPQPHETIIEVGPGKGVLTQFLIKNPNPVRAIDIDSESIEYLNQNLKSPNLEIVYHDILTYDFPDNTVLIGNLPYNISSPIFFHVLSNIHKIRRGVVMIQKEVADRICAGCGTRESGILTVLMEYAYKTKNCFKVKPGSFYPPPGVDSAVMTFERKDDREDLDFESFKKFTKLAYSQRRKMLRNTLSGLHKPIPEFYQTKRPEELSFEQILALFHEMKD